MQGDNMEDIVLTIAPPAMNILTHQISPSLGTVSI